MAKVSPTIDNLLAAKEAREWQNERENIPAILHEVERLNTGMKSYMEYLEGPPENERWGHNDFWSGILEPLQKLRALLVTREEVENSVERPQNEVDKQFYLHILKRHLNTVYRE